MDEQPFYNGGLLSPNATIQNGSLSINAEIDEPRYTAASPRGENGDSKSWETWVDSDYVATANQLNSTPFQYVFPNFFTWLHNCGCCRWRDLNQKVGKTSI
jgi:hypothetical protein